MSMDVSFTERLLDIRVSFCTEYVHKETLTQGFRENERIYKFQNSDVDKIKIPIHVWKMISTPSELMHDQKVVIAILSPAWVYYIISI